MTPRQITAYMLVAGRRLRMERAGELNLMATAFRSEHKAVASLTKELMQER